MADMTWERALEELLKDPTRSALAPFFRASDAERRDNAVVVKVPGKFYVTLLDKPDVTGTLKSLYGVTSVSFVADAAAAERLKTQNAQPVVPGVPRPAPKPADAKLAQLLERLEYSYKTEHFDISDNLAETFKPEKNPYVVTAANGPAYRTIRRLADKFPEIAGAQPVMVRANVGMGKTHLLQTFAWEIARKIAGARQLMRTQNLSEAKALLNIPDATADEAYRKMEKAATARVRYVTAEQFVDEHIRATNKSAWDKEEEHERFKRQRDSWYRTLDVVFVDDLHAFAKGEKESTLEKMYEIADDCYRAGKMLVTAIDTDPKLVIEQNKSEKIRKALERVFSRCYGGGVIAIENPSREELADVLSHTLKTMNAELRNVTPDELKSGSFYSVARSFRDAHSVAETAYNYHTNEGMSLDAALAKGIALLKSKLQIEKPQGDLF